MTIRIHRAVIVATILLFANAEAQNPADAQSRAAVSGTVIDAVTGQPVRAAEIYATALSANDNEAETTPTLTDASGRFAIGNLEPGRYVLQASHDGYTSPDHLSGPGSAGIVTLAPAQRLEDAVVSLMPGGTIAGRITDATRTPIVGASLQAMKYTYRDGKPHLEEAESVSTNARGEYRMTGLVPGNYYLRATNSRRSVLPRQDQADVPLYYPDSSDFTHAAKLTVGAGQEMSGIDVTLAPLPTLHIRGRVIDARGSLPCKGAAITVLSDLGNTFFSSGQISTDAQGRFDFPGVPSGSYVLVARLDADTHRETTLWGRKSVAVADVSVDDVKILVSAGATVGGRIRIEGNKPLDVRNLQVRLEPQEGATLNSLMPAVGDASVGRNGVFVFHNVPEGAYNVNVFPLPAGYYLADQEESGALETGLVVGPFQSLPLDLILSPVSAIVEGVVSGDAPFAGASVVLVPDARRRSQPRYYRTSLSNRLGKFRFQGVPPGDYKLFAWDEIQAGAFMDPDFLREYEDRGQTIHLEQSAHVTVQLGMIAALR